MTSVVLGGGGERVVAWEVGVLAGLLDAGVDLRDATCVVGTSAGAVVAARLAAGIDPRADAERHARRRSVRSVVVSFAGLAEAREVAGDAEPFIARIATLLPDAWPEALTIVAIDADTGERVVFDAGSHVPLARAVAASRAVPGLLPPVRIGGRRCIDGSLGSATNADLAGPGYVIAALGAEPAPRAVLIDAGPADLAAMGRSDAAAVAAGRARALAQMSPRLAA